MGCVVDFVRRWFLVAHASTLEDPVAAFYTTTLRDLGKADSFHDRLS